VILSTGSGPGGRWFKSIRPDHFQNPAIIGLCHLCHIDCRSVLWTLVYQLKAAEGAVMVVLIKDHSRADFSGVPETEY
jgi:hypothetical protein